MGLFNRKKSSTPPLRVGGPEGGTRDSDYEKRLKEDFGIEPEGNQWSYVGQSTDLSEMLKDPEVSHGVLKNLKKEFGFANICIVTTPQMVFIACDRKPPLGLVTGLNAQTVANLIAAVLKENQTTVSEYFGTWRLTL